MEKAISKLSEKELDEIKDLVLNDLNSNISKQMYGLALDDFLGWYEIQGFPGLSKATVNSYKTHLASSTDYAPATINAKLSAIKKLAREAADNGYIDEHIALSIDRVKGQKTLGRKAGNWLTLEQSQKLLRTPDLTKLKGYRDRAILAIMLGAGLRRSEVADLTFDHVQQRDGRWVIVDILGKGGRTRLVPIPSWSKQAIDEWAEQAGISSGHIFRSITIKEEIGDSITPQGIANVVKQYAKECGFTLAAHDLRRTYAKLSREGGSEIPQIQKSLGHASAQTTEAYINETQDLTNAPCDFIRLRL